jgi:hypothetical protein
VAGRRSLASASVERWGGVTPREASASDWEAIDVTTSRRLWRPASWAKTKAPNGLHRLSTRLGRPMLEVLSNKVHLD